MKFKLTKNSILSAAVLLALLLYAAACSPKTPEMQAQPVEQEQPAEEAAQPKSDELQPTVGFELGSRLEDFSIMLSDGTEITLYGLLKEKRAVLLNFWATWCGPCELEFPYLEQAYNEMSDQIGVLALSAWPSDTNEAVLEYKKNVGLTTLPMGLDTAGLSDGFRIEAFPTSVMIDRNGIVCFREEGSIPDKEKFLRIFSVYTAENYKEPVILNDVPKVLPSVEQPDESELKKALKLTDSNVSIKATENEAIWPFVPIESEDGLKASNGAVKDSRAALSLSVDARSGDALAYEYASNLPPIYDEFTVSVDGMPVKSYGGAVDWTPDSIRFDNDGEHTVVFSFGRGIMTDDISDAKLRGLRLISAADIETTKKAEPKTLNGTECAIQPTESSLKTFRLVMRLQGADYSEDYNILQGDRLTVRISVGEELNQDIAFVGMDDEFVMLQSLRSDENGYYYQIEKTGDAKAGQNPLRSIYLLAAGADGQFGSDYNASFSWFNSEADVDSYVELLREAIEAHDEKDYELYWEYHDGSPEQSGTEQTAAAGEEAEYIIIVTDEQGKPVEGAVVQICDETTCKMDKTGADGRVTHTGIRYPYEIHLLKAPDGFAKDAQTYVLPEEGGSLEIKLKRQ